jgi:UrcA family protein
MRTSITVAAALALITGAAPAVARNAERPGDTPRIQTVAYGDLDLSKATDIAKLRHRVAAATEAVCGSYAQSSEDAAHEIARCRREVKASVDPQLARLIGSRDARYARASDR